MPMKAVRMTFAMIALPMLAICLALAACGDDAAEADKKPAQAAAAATAFAAEQQAWRDERRASLLKPDGWTSLIGLHWIEPGSHYLGSDADNGIRLAMGPEHLGLLDRKGDAAALRPGARRAADPRWRSRLTRRRDAQGRHRRGRPEHDRLRRRQGRRHRDQARRPLRIAGQARRCADPRPASASIEYWPGGPRLEDRRQVHRRIPPGKTIADRQHHRHDRARCPIPARSSSSATARRSGSKRWTKATASLFLIFADRTSGHGSYGAGRFLYAPMPDAQGKVVLDFNRGLQPAVRVHRVRDLPVAAAGKPPRPRDHGGREGLRQARALTMHQASIEGHPCAC